MSCEGRERAKGRESGPLRGHLRARGGAGIGEGPDCAVGAAFAHLSESIPIAYQYTKHVNDMCAPAHHATLRSQSPGDAAQSVSAKRCATHGASQSARSQPAKLFSVERYATRLVSAQSAQVIASQGLEKPRKSRACAESGA
jgi:hypothetical protein